MKAGLIRGFAALTVTLAVLAACGGGGTRSPSAPVTTSAVLKAPVSGTSPIATGTSAPIPPTQSAGDAVKQLFSYIDRGQFDREWDVMDPLQQAFVPKDLYIECASKILSGTGIVNVRILETYTENVGVPGTGLTNQPSTAVTVQLTVSRAGQQQTEKDTFHMFDVNGQWRWVVSDPEPYRAGQCPNQ